MPGPVRSIYAQIYVKGSHRALKTPRVGRPWRPRVIAWAGPTAFYRNRFYEIDRWYKARIPKPPRFPQLHVIDPEKHWKSLEERLAEEKARPEDLVDIGYALKQHRSSVDGEQKTEQQPDDDDRQLALVDLSAVVAASKVGSTARLICSHYGIFRDLFHPDAFFHPVLPLSIAYDYDAATVSAVHLGNTLTPSETATRPLIHYEANANSYWTLLVTNPDGNPFEHGKEIVHLFIGNIPGGDIDKGEVLFDYLQPLPFKGTGWHRIVFLLFRQDKGRIDYSRWMSKREKSEKLDDRTFSTPDFYKSNEGELTPAGVAFFQTSWDASCQRCLYDRFDATQPLYQYEWTPPFKMEQEEYPSKPQPFDLYLDQFRDAKEMEEEMLMKRLSLTDPMQPPPQKPKYPDLSWKENRRKLPGWQHERLMKENSGHGRYGAIWRNRLD